jgi:hypothetical protein
MSQITLRGQGGPLPLHANGKFQSASPLSSTPGAYGTSVTEDVAQLVGTRWDLNDGREVILVSNSSTTTSVPGLLYQDPALISGNQNLVVTEFVPYGTSGGVANSGSTPATVTVTLGGAAVTANQYQGGYVIVSNGAGIGQTLRIASHPAQASTTGNLTITLEDAPNTALTTSSTVSLVPAHGQNVIVSPTTHTNVPVGIALYPIPPSGYGYLVSQGLVAAVSDALPAAAGVAIAPSVTTPGAVTVATNSSTDLTSTIIGTAATLGVSAEAQAVFINL